MHKIQQIFNSAHNQFMSPTQKKTFNAIKSCRTSALGAHIHHCKDCDYTEVLYNSCRNRHCPICQGAKQEEWVQAQLAKLLPVSYFHVVFTLPHQLNTIIIQNQQLLYSILMKSSADTIKELAEDPKYLGAQVGITGVLHTWGQNLSFHPHWHCIVPGGGLSFDGLRFVRSGKKFFLPVKVMSRKFRGKFLYHLKKAWNEEKIELFNQTRELLEHNNFQKLIDQLYNMDWVVYCKKPFKTPHHVVKYLGRYTHRVAISDARIENFIDGHVTFKWKDYKDHNKVKSMSLDTSEFVRRFLLHVLPTGFTKIRHYGLLSSRNIGNKLLLCIRLTGNTPRVEKTDQPPKCCPSCGGTIIIFHVRKSMLECT